METVYEGHKWIYMPPRAAKICRTCGGPINASDMAFYQRNISEMTDSWHHAFCAPILVIADSLHISKSLLIDKNFAYWLVKAKYRQTCRNCACHIHTGQTYIAFKDLTVNGSHKLIFCVECKAVHYMTLMKHINNSPSDQPIPSSDMGVPCEPFTLTINLRG